MVNYISINFIYTREKNRLSRKEFAEKYGISYGAMSSYERAISLPPIDVLQFICNDLELNIDDFINKDLSKLKKENYYVEEVKEPYHIIDKKTETMLQHIIETQTKTIETKDALVNEKQKVITVLEKQINRLEALLNQNGINK